jgi:tRNA 2-thiouridine synthesizing protein A
MAMKFEKTGDNTFTLDVCGYVCPHPQIYCKKALEKIKEGDVLEILFDNPSSSESITSMCTVTGDEIIEQNTEGGKYKWKLKKVKRD